MRDMLEEAEAHRTDGYRAAKIANRQPELRRFYKEVSVGPQDGGWAVLLDGKPVRTPGRKIVAAPSEALAEAMAAEFAAQGEVVQFRDMPIVRLVNAAVEGGAEAAGAMREEIAKFAGTDLLLYRADSPESLVAAQDEAWDPVLVALARRLGVKFQPTIGIVHQAQPAITLQRVRETLEGEGHVALAALLSITNLTGSALLTVALRLGLSDPDAVWTAAHVDEDFNRRQWGEDAEAAARRAFRTAEYEAAVAVLGALGSVSANQANRTTERRPT